MLGVVILPMHGIDFFTLFQWMLCKEKLYLQHQF